MLLAGEKINFLHLKSCPDHNSVRNVSQVQKPLVWPACLHAFVWDSLWYKSIWDFRRGKNPLHSFCFLLILRSLQSIPHIFEEGLVIFLQQRGVEIQKWEMTYLRLQLHLETVPLYSWSDGSYFGIWFTLLGPEKQCCCCFPKKHLSPLKWKYEGLMKGQPPGGWYPV